MAKSGSSKGLPSPEEWPPFDVAAVMAELRTYIEGVSEDDFDPHKSLEIVFAHLHHPKSVGRAFTDIITAGKVESDRGFVLVAAAIIDNQLGDMFRTLFSKSSDATADEAEFFLSAGALPPLQSTGLKIRYAHVLGLIDRPLMRALNQLQSLRSKVAAHSREIMKIRLSHSADIAQHLPEFNLKFRKMISPESLAKMKDGSTWRTPKGLLMRVAVELVFELERFSKALSRRRAQSPPKRVTRSAQANTARRASSDKDGHKPRNESGT